MIDREKVIKAIEYCTDNSLVCHGDECPYWKDGVSNIVCWNNVMKDAGELLKADKRYLKDLEPHLIELSEIKENEAYWLDVHGFGSKPRPVICVHVENDARKPYITLAWQFGTFSWEAETYGTEWCLWSARPDVA